MKPVVDHVALEAELGRRLSERVRLMPLAEGEESRAFGLRSSLGELVLRLHPTGAGYAKDAFVARAFGAAGIPIPPVHAVGLVDNGLHYCLSQRAPGVTLQDLDRPGLARVVAKVAGVMEAMADADVAAIEGYGPFDPLGRGSHDSWRQYVADIADPETHDWLQDASPGTPPFRLLDLVLNLAEACPEVRGLVHGDFGSNNVLADDDRVSGVIDWSEAMVGDPLYDLANILFWRPWLDCMEQQARYFERARSERLADRRRLACYQLRIGLGELWSALRSGNRRMAAWALSRCEEIAAERRL